MIIKIHNLVVSFAILFRISIAVVAQIEVENETRLVLEPVLRSIQLNEDYLVSWTVQDSSTNEISFKLEVKTLGYIGFGISANGAMKGADIVNTKVLDNGQITIEDRHGVGNTEPVLDDTQNWFLRSASRNGTHTTLEIYRLLNTEDTLGDLEINGDTLRLIWAYGMDNRDTLTYHGTENRGFLSVNFLDPDVETPSLQEMEKIYNVWRTQKRVRVSSNDTVYMCSFFKGPNVTQKQHIVGFGMHLDKPEAKRHLHHADLYRCSAPPGKDADAFFAPYMGDGYDCNYSPEPFPYEHCGMFEFQWTLGGGITMFPDNLGMPIGNSNGKTEYFMTEVHFDNPQRRSDLELEAGFNIYYTSKLRETEVGHLQLGVMTNKTYAVTIPPNSTDFVVSSHCPMDCTSNLPEKGINVFTYLLHSHLSGRKLKLRHFREGSEIETLAKDDHFDFNYQNNRRLRTPVKILQNDHLTLECVYDTNWKGGKTTLGGRSARDEMCQAFLLYYPRVDNINSCGSYNIQQNILDFMGLERVSQEQGEIDATVTSPQYLAGLKYSEVVEKRINWTAEHRNMYQDLIRYGEQRAYCIPIQYHNETFVLTNYPVIERPMVGYFSMLYIYLGIGIIVVITCLAVGTLYNFRKRKMDKNEKN